MSYRPISDIWWCARAKLKGGAKYYGAYPGGFLERARALLGIQINDPVLHICAGRVNLYPYKRGFGPNDKTLDLDPDMEPDFLQDARDPYPLGFRAILADPPYTPNDAAQYKPGALVLPPPGRIIRLAFDALPHGGRVGILHYFPPSPPANAIFVASITVKCGFNNRPREFAVFEKWEPESKGEET